MSAQPSVLFVCVKNGGKSQIAAALMRQLGGISVSSAGTKPGGGLNPEAVEAVAERGASMQGETPTAIDPALLASVDRVVIIGDEAKVDPVPDMKGSIETWVIDEPSLRGVQGMERMRLVRDDIADRVSKLRDQLLATPVAKPVIRVFEPAMCCDTGVCGPDIDESLVNFTADLDYLRASGVDIERHNLASDPGAFVNNLVASQFLRVVGSSGLPLVLVDDVTVATGRYPDRSELARLAGLEVAPVNLLNVSQAGGCCDSDNSSGCC